MVQQPCHGCGITELGHGVGGTNTQQSELSVILLLRSLIFEAHVTSGNADGGGGCGWVASSIFFSAGGAPPIVEGLAVVQVRDSHQGGATVLRGPA